MIVIEPTSPSAGQPSDPARDAALDAASASPSEYIVIVDRDLCIGAATCVDLAPKTFGLDGENKAIICGGPWDDSATVLAAAKSCPTLAITVQRRDTGEQVFP